jgi:SAM-dependent methyltransferase
LDAAVTALRRAVELAPDQAVARKNLGMTLMQLGEYREGWPLYGSRWVADERSPRDYPKPLWQGEPLDGRTLLLYSEQGLGDAIQFARFVPVLAEAGTRVVLEMHPQLITLMRSLKGAAEIFPLGGAPPTFDVFLPLMDVPAVTGMTTETIPCPTPYLAADPQRVETWRECLGEGGFKVGIVWQGNNDTFRKRARTAPLSAFAPLAEIEGVRLIGLQKPGDGGADPTASNIKVETFGPDFDAGPDAFIDTAAVIANLDLIITIDTSVAHLAGAMGRPVWIALPRVPDWRFGIEGSDCPWYPTARLFRQRVAGDWSDVFAEIAEQLRALVAAPPVASAPIRIFPEEGTALRHMPLPLPPSSAAPSAAPARAFARLNEFMRGIAWSGAPELASEPHISITSTTIESLSARGLLKSGSRVLDIGCGHGLALEMFSKLGLSAVGITSGADSEICRAKGLDVRAMDQNSMDFADASFDVLWCRQVLQRSPVPLFTLAEYRRVTRPGGLVYVDVPAPDTESHHEANPAYFCVLPLSSWLSLFARAGFAVETGAAIGVGDGGNADTHWSFLLRRT